MGSVPGGVGCSGWSGSSARGADDAAAIRSDATGATARRPQTAAAACDRGAAAARRPPPKVPTNAIAGGAANKRWVNGQKKKWSSSGSRVEWGVAARRN